MDSQDREEALRRRLERLPKRRLVDLLIELGRRDPGLLAGPDDAAPARRSKELLALGRPNEAFAVLWDSFRHTLSMSHLHAATALAPRGRAARLEAEALEIAEQHPDADRALGFLLARGAWDRAAAFFGRRFGELSDGAQVGLNPLATALQEQNPRQAWQLLGLTLAHILENHSVTEDDQGQEVLRQMEQIARAGGFLDEHRAFLEQVRIDHADRSSFWQHLPG